MTYAYNPDTRPILDDWLRPESIEENSALRDQARLLIEKLEIENRILRKAVLTLAKWMARE